MSYQPTLLASGIQQPQFPFETHGGQRIASAGDLCNQQPRFPDREAPSAVPVCISQTAVVRSEAEDGDSSHKRQVLSLKMLQGNKGAMPEHQKMFGMCKTTLKVNKVTTTQFEKNLVASSSATERRQDSFLLNKATMMVKSSTMENYNFLFKSLWVHSSGKRNLKLRDLVTKKANCGFCSEPSFTAKCHTILKS